LKIFIAGASGYIGKQLLVLLLQSGHYVVALVRQRNRLPDCILSEQRLTVIEGDLLKKGTIKTLPSDIDIAYYLVHSMSDSYAHFSSLEEQAAYHFVDILKITKIRQIIYLGGLFQQECASALSKHLSSRRRVEEVLGAGSCPVTVLRAGIVIGPGSASFEIMRDIVEKLPFILVPSYLSYQCQPISIKDVLDYLYKVMDRSECFSRTFDIGGADVLSYGDMLIQFSKMRGLRRAVIRLSVFSQNFLSRFLHFFTHVPTNLGRALMESLSGNAVCNNTHIHSLVPKVCGGFQEAIASAFSVIEDHHFITSKSYCQSTQKWTSSAVKYAQAPKHGCFIDVCSRSFMCECSLIEESVWSIGGDRGWYFANWLWKFRGWVDCCVGGGGLQKGRRHPTDLSTGDQVDCWHVVVSDKEGKRLLLYAQMRLPGEAWLEFEIIPGKSSFQGTLKTRAIFRPFGICGRLYWILMYPFHRFVFKNMVNKIVSFSEALSN
tara:strand:- start:6256 stop:7725 length:1470 start_codon:yes stop_codon:yes gene_type:complete